MLVAKIFELLLCLNIPLVHEGLGIAHCNLLPVSLDDVDPLTPDLLVLDVRNTLLNRVHENGSVSVAGILEGSLDDIISEAMAHKGVKSGRLTYF